MTANDTSLRHAVLDAYRDELRGRYLLDNIRRFPEFAPISAQKIESLRDHFLELIYPSSQDRDRLDDAFDRVGEIMRSPRRLTPLMKTAFQSAWRLGILFPSAVAAGAHMLETYLETRKLEVQMLEYARRMKLDVTDLTRRETIVQMIANVPEREVVWIRTEVLKLFRALSNVKLLAAAVDIMENSRDFMAARPDLYREQELAGFSLGYQVLRQGLALFQTLEPSEFPIILQGIEAVEVDWYDRIKAEAAAL